MANIVHIYGHSDDCIEVDGAVRDEFSCYDSVKYLHFNDGTVVEAQYSPPDDEAYYWRIRVLKRGIGTTSEVGPGTYHGDGEGMKCDKVTLTGDIRSVRCYKSVNGPTKDDIESFFEDWDYSGLSQEKLRRIMEIAQE